MSRTLPVYVEAAGCTNACRHCAADGRPPFGAIYTLGELRELSREWGRLIPYYEPTAHPEFPEILSPDISLWESVLSTNGYGISRREDHVAIFARLREYEFEALSLTLHGLEQDHDSFVGRRGAFRDIVETGRRAHAAGFEIYWQVYLDRQNAADIPALATLAHEEFGVKTHVTLPYHRVSRRMWRYEALRPALRDIQGQLDSELIVPAWKQPLEELTETAWLDAWQEDAQADEFKHPFEPRTWPPSSSEGIAIYIAMDRKVYLDPICSRRIRLGELAEGRERLVERLRGISEPEECKVQPAQGRRLLGDQDLLHPAGYSVRNKAFSAALFGRA